MDISASSNGSNESNEREEGTSIEEAMESFPLKAGVFPSYGSVEDFQDIADFRISKPDIHNAGKHLYAMIAQTLHVFEQLSFGTPYSWVSGDDADNTHSANSKRYRQMLRDLRDEFIWLHDNDASAAPYDESMYAPGELDMSFEAEDADGTVQVLFPNHDPEMQKKRTERDDKHAAEYARRREAAFARLSREIDSMWD